jgi:hypothetical protein
VGIVGGGELTDDIEIERGIFRCELGEEGVGDDLQQSLQVVRNCQLLQLPLASLGNLLDLCLFLHDLVAAGDHLVAINDLLFVRSQMLGLKDLQGG